MRNGRRAVWARNIAMVHDGQTQKLWDKVPLGNNQNRGDLRPHMERLHVWFSSFPSAGNIGRKKRKMGMANKVP